MGLKIMLKTAKTKDASCKSEPLLRIKFCFWSSFFIVLLLGILTFILTWSLFEAPEKSPPVSSHVKLSDTTDFPYLYKSLNIWASAPMAWSYLLLTVGAVIYFNARKKGLCFLKLGYFYLAIKTITFFWVLTLVLSTYFLSYKTVKWEFYAMERDYSLWMLTIDLIITIPAFLVGIDLFLRNKNKTVNSGVGN